MFGAKLRFRSPDSVVAEMLALRKTYPEHDYAFSFQADTLTTSKEWMLEFCDQIIANNLQGIPWVADSRVNTIDTEIIKAMKRAGCFTIHFGVESGSQKVLDFLNKRITVEESKRVHKLCYKNNIIPQAYLMVGTPTETKEDIEMTCQFVREARPAYVNVSKTTPVPGSNMYDYVSERGMLNISNFSDFDYYHNKYPIKLENMTAEDLENYSRKIMKIWATSFLKRPFSFLFQFLGLLYRFPHYRLFIMKYAMRGLRVGTTGQFLALIMARKKS
jgi:radical SAM superfamily enzyme YgiQ (UPF0313 family)